MTVFKLFPSLVNWRRDIQLLEKMSRNPSSLASPHMDCGTGNLTWLIMTVHDLICIQSFGHTLAKEPLVVKRLRRHNASNSMFKKNWTQTTFLYALHNTRPPWNFLSSNKNLYIGGHPGEVAIWQSVLLWEISSLESKLLSGELPESHLSVRFSAAVYFHPHSVLV